MQFPPPPPLLNVSCRLQLTITLPLFMGIKGWMRSLFTVLEKVGSKKTIKAEALKAVGAIISKDPTLMDLPVRGIVVCCLTGRLASLLLAIRVVDDCRVFPAPRLLSVWCGCGCCVACPPFVMATTIIVMCSVVHCVLCSW